MINVQNIKQVLDTHLIGRDFHFFEEIDSTNLRGHQMAAAGSTEGTVLVAEYQTSGKGRQGRGWYATKGENILMSIILRPDIAIDAIHLITFLTSVVVIETIQSYLKQFDLPGLDLHVKWPNDIMINRKKVAGILTECKSKGKAVVYLVVGIGINVNQTFTDNRNELGKGATSLRSELLQTVDRARLLRTLIKKYDANYLRASANNFETVVQEWKKYWEDQYKQIKIYNGTLSFAGVVQDIEHDGRLLIKNDRGKCILITSGEMVQWN
jgi:BirA family biotin operon repressor/biotin-[acetyl-CoA-carboxylase] ligase